MTLRQDRMPVRTGEDDGVARERVTRRRRAGLRPLLWRLHFLGGFLVAPVVLSLAITGILFAWNPQIESVLHRDTLTAAGAGAARPLGDQLRAARAEHPGWEVTGVVPVSTPTGTTAVSMHPPDAPTIGFGPAEGAVTVYVDPAAATVTGEIVEAQRPGEWLRSLHSSWRLGPAAEPLTELAASWVLVSLLTGMYLWWPQSRKALTRSFRLRRPGRMRWRSVHSLLGVGVLVGLVLMIGTGLTWTTYAGAWVTVAKSQLGSETPSVSTELAADAGGTGGSGGHGGHAGHGGSGAADAGPAADPADSIERVAEAAAGAGLDGVVSLEPPGAAGQAWAAGIVDSRWPIEATSVAIDPATGAVTDRVEWADYPLLAKATTLGIGFHQAELFGLANQLLLTVLAVALIVLVVAGYRMWWLRRPAGGLGVPPRMGPLLRTVPVPLLVGFGVLMVLLPTLGVSFLLFLVVERVVRSVRA